LVILGVDVEHNVIYTCTVEWLIEQIYSTPGWMEMFGVADERGYRSGQTAELRKKLGGMSAHELVEVLLALS
jgi:hypothetical protein